MAADLKQMHIFGNRSDPGSIIPLVHKLLSVKKVGVLELLDLKLHYLGNEPSPTEPFVQPFIEPTSRDFFSTRKKRKMAEKSDSPRYSRASPQGYTL